MHAKSRASGAFRVLLMGVTLSLLAASCSTGVGQGPSDEGTSGGTGGGSGGSGEKSLVCVMPKLVGIPYFNASEKGAEEAAKELGVKLNYDGPTKAQAAKQVQIIQQWTQRGCDAISVSANDPDALASAMKKAGDAGIKTSAWDADVADDSRDYFVSQATHESIGETMADIMAEETGNKGELLVVTGSLTAPNQNAWIDAMKKQIKDKYPDMEIASVEPGEEDFQKSLDVTKNYLRAHPDTAGVVGLTSVSAPAAAEAVKQMNLTNKVAVTGTAAPSQMKEYIKPGEAGTVEKFALWSPVDLGYLTVYVAYHQIQGDMPSKEGETIDAGRLGKVKLSKDDVVLLGDPLVFSEENIDKYDF